MFIDENSSPMLKSAYDKGKEEGIKEGMERAAVIADRRLLAINPSKSIAAAIRKEIK